MTRAPVALMNMVSSNINQWGVLSGLLAVIYCWSHGSTAPLPFDAFQRSEILLTILQAFLGWIFLASMDLEANEAGGLFVLWLVQFLVPSLRHTMLFVYGAWIVLEVGLRRRGPEEARRLPGLRPGLERAAVTRHRLADRAPGDFAVVHDRRRAGRPALAASGVDVVDFGVGEPDFATPDFVAAAGAAAIAAGQTKYTDVAGEARRCATRSRRSTAWSTAPPTSATTCS